MPDLRDQLQEIFGLDEFRPAQRGVIEDVLAARDVLCVMPTGAGKSLCYQFPAAVQGGLTVVVSPLISLMEDQVQQLRDEGLSAAMLNSSLTATEAREVLAQLHAGFEGLLYVAPERFFAGSFQGVIEKLKPKLLAVDEAHCISQWGHDFRPEYSQLGEVRRKLGMPPTIALTATATEDVREDIIHQLGLREPQVVVTGFDRPNLLYESRRVTKVADKNSELVSLLKSESGGAIVYCSTRKAVDELTTTLSGALSDRRIFAYHAGMDVAARTSNQEQFMQTPRAIAVATNAFGMGINKPDTRLVVHYNIPGTLEAYYQEAGRAGRDGMPARCVMLFSYQDRFTQEFFIDKIGEETHGDDPAVIQKIEDRKLHARKKLEQIIQYAGTHRCRRQMILDYFGDETEVKDCSCDVCQRERGGTVIAPSGAAVPDEVVTIVRQLLSGVARLNRKFGVGAVAEVLAGADNERIQRWRLNELTVYGLLRAHSIKRIIAMLHRLMESGLARQRATEGERAYPVVEITPAGVAVMKGEAPPPATLADLMPSRRSASSRAESQVNRLAEEEDSQLDASDPDLLARFERLRRARLELSRKRQLPPYCICHDRTLKLIARNIPADVKALEQIKGMGPYKIEQYGEALLEALKG